jgi:pimeloyl-ACP methyl ester carboxylesterase
MNENQLKFQLAHWKEMKTLFRHLSSIRTLCAIRKAQKNISVPTLLLVGTYDRIISAKHTIKGFKRYIPNVEIYTFENSGHLPFEEEKELFVSKVVEFASK